MQRTNGPRTDLFDDLLAAAGSCNPPKSRSEVSVIRSVVSATSGRPFVALALHDALSCSTFDWRCCVTSGKTALPLAARFSPNESTGSGDVQKGQAGVYLRVTSSTNDL